MTLDFYVIRDQYDSALAAIDRLDQRVQDPYLNYQRGSIAFAQGEYGQSQEYAEDLIRFDSTLSEPYLLMATIVPEQKDFEAPAKALGRMQTSGADEIAFKLIDVDPEFTEFAESKEYEELKRQFHIEHNGRDAKNQHPAHFNVTSEIQSQNPTPAGVPPSCPSPPSRRCRRRCRF